MWSSQDKIPAGSLNWSQRKDNNGDCINMGVISLIYWWRQMVHERRGHGFKSLLNKKLGELKDFLKDKRKEG